MIVKKFFVILFTVYYLIGAAVRLHFWSCVLPFGIHFLVKMFELLKMSLALAIAISVVLT